MRFIDYIKSLAPSTERRELLNQLDDLKDEYDSSLAPILDLAEELLLGMEHKSFLYKAYADQVGRSINYRGDPLQLFFESLSNVRANMEVLQETIRNLFSFQFTNTGLTFNRANVLKYLEALNFYIRYGRKFLLFMIAQETMARGKAAPMKWTRAENDWVRDHMTEFVSLYPAMSLKPAELKARFKQASTAEVNEETYELAVRSLGQAQIDPCRLDGFSPQNSPFLILGKYMAEMRVKRFQAAKEEYFGMQLRLQELRESVEGKPASPVLQKQIEQYEKRISDYEFEIAQIEEEARG